MRELQVVMSDDLTFAATGERVPADETLIIALDGRTRELDVTAEHAKEIRTLLGPLMEAGHPPGGQPGAGPTPGKGQAHDSRGSTPTPELIVARARQRAVREWADARGLKSEDGQRPIYRTAGGGYYYPYRLIRAYEADMRRQGKIIPQ